MNWRHPGAPSPGTRLTLTARPDGPGAFESWQLWPDRGRRHVRAPVSVTGREIAASVGTRAREAGPFRSCTTARESQNSRPLPSAGSPPASPFLGKRLHTRLLLRFRILLDRRAKPKAPTREFGNRRREVGLACVVSDEIRLLHAKHLGCLFDPDDDLAGCGLELIHIEASGGIEKLDSDEMTALVEIENDIVSHTNGASDSASAIAKLWAEEDVGEVVFPVDVNERQHGSLGFRVNGYHQDDVARRPLVDDPDSAPVGRARDFIPSAGPSCPVRTPRFGENLEHFCRLHVAQCHASLCVWRHHHDDRLVTEFTLQHQVTSLPVPIEIDGFAGVALTGQALALGSVGGSCGLGGPCVLRSTALPGRPGR